MPPKKKGGGKGIKSKEKVKKVVEDKTFGMKNKNKSKKAQQYIKQVEKEAMTGGKSHRQIQLEEQAKLAKSRKQLKKEKEMENAELFKTVVSAPKQGMSAGADPKSTLCAFFKAGLCKHGKKCKFSHDMSLDRKAAKLNVYEDPRANDTMDSWDQEKLEEVVKTKMGTLPPTDIICKHFIKAIEEKKYGWLWQCPNGPKCHYRHALPPGYVLKKDEKKDDEDEDEGETIVEQIERERRALDASKLTPMTEELFLKWKEEEEQRRVKEVAQKAKEVKQKAKAKGSNAQLSGRDLFTFDPSMFVDDDEAADDDAYVIREDFAESAEAKQAAADVANVNDADLFLDDDVELPSDDDEDDDDEE
jgi:hypothetical protein